MECPYEYIVNRSLAYVLLKPEYLLSTSSKPHRIAGSKVMIALGSMPVSQSGVLRFENR